MPSNGFTDRTQEALRTAQEIVQQRKHSQLDVEHILLALLLPQDGLVTQIVAKLNADRRELAWRLNQQLDSNPRLYSAYTGLAEIHISMRAQRVVSAAAEEAAKLGDQYIGVEHLLLAIAAERGGTAARLLSEANIDQWAIHAAIRALRATAQAATGSGPAAATAPSQSTSRSAGRASTQGGFTDQAQEVLRTAQEIVQQKRHSQLDVEHILLAVLKVPDSLVVQLVESLGVDPVTLISWVEGQLSTHPVSSASYTGLAQIHISMRAQRVVSGASGEALKLGAHYIGAEHLFLPILDEPDSPTARMLSEMGIDRSRLYTMLQQSHPILGGAERLRQGMPVAPESAGDEDTGAGTLRIRGPVSRLGGRLSVPGDKSISHRAALFGSLGAGPTQIRGFLPANDCLATLQIVQALGVPVDYRPDQVVVHGRGMDGWQEPERPLFCGGSGTTIRLIAGLLAGQAFYSILDGNAQLRRRPMARVADPLRQMGATILGRQAGKLAPLSIGGGGLHGIDYQTPVASAQVKSAVLLAGLFADGTTTVREPSPSRDHTERMLLAMGAQVRRESDTVVSVERSTLQPLSITVPGDISSAAFLLAAGAIVPGAQIRLDGVGVNPTRTGVIDVLRAMGAAIQEEGRHEEHGEPVADLLVESGPLSATRIEGALIPRLIDELPVLAVVATQAHGVTEVRDAAELRVKETDRIATVAEELGKMGARIEPLPDGFRVHGPTPLHGAAVSSHGDHRMAMALAVAALVADGETIIGDTRCIADSYPGFAAALGALGVAIDGDGA